MIGEVPLTLVNIDFLETYYYYRNDDNDPYYSTEKDFKGCLAHFHQPNDKDAKQGDLLSVQEWKSLRRPKEKSIKVLLQVFNMMPIWLDKLGTQKENHFLHAVLVRPWHLCSEDSFMGFWGKGRTHLDRMLGQISSLFLVLDRPVNLSVSHLYKTGHIGILLELPFFEDLLARSKAFRRMPDFHWESSSPRVGQTKEEDQENRNKYIKASNIQHTFRFIDSSFVKLQSFAPDSDLVKVHALMVNDISEIFTPPFDSMATTD